MSKLRELIGQPTTKAATLLLILFLIFVWYRSSSESTVSVSAVSENQKGSVIIPKISVTAPLVYAHSNDPDDIDNLLRESVVHMVNSPAPGDKGNVYFVGRGVFDRLPELQVDDDILVTNNASESLVYKVIDIKVVNTSNNGINQPTDKRRLLTLETSYPGGNSMSRYLVIAELK
jgi:LPXTG-site transpeptidase (sortase) family protein